MALFLMAIFCALTAKAQNYLISFAGTGASNIVNTVKVENLRTGESIILNGEDILHLTETTGINSPEDNQSSEIRIYPNPMTENSIIEVYPPVTGDAIITIHEITGKQIFRAKNYLEHGEQEFRISGMNSGLYLINIKGSTYQYSAKLLCTGKSNGTIRIEKVSNNVQSVEREKSGMDDKGVKGNVNMAYAAGDRLKFTGISGIYSTVMTDIPTSDKTIIFNFILCKDGDNNNYPIVVIGTQTWMAENLKTTKYKKGTGIPLVADVTAWGALKTPAFCWYNNDEAAYKNTYGALYNWYTVKTDSLCPTGWHVSTDAEWTTLTDYLGGLTMAGSKLKETGPFHWGNPNSGVTNESGFTALPGGYRASGGGFSVNGSYGFWWSSTEYDQHDGWFRYMVYSNITVIKSYMTFGTGYSVPSLLLVATLKEAGVQQALQWVRYSILNFQGQMEPLFRAFSNHTKYQCLMENKKIKILRYLNTRKS
jgi:uncharacterized protein (TIGR02145 family)